MIAPEFLTEEEKQAFSCLAEAWNAFVDLPALHSDDRTEFRQAIHQAQRIVLARPALRQLNDR